ncbi:uncharacterized protein LOC123253306 [Gracilinanus agilis]|uniref:uncharacterized protein LOC123253306 n=1 Tax=Gracilinanus agilis TaxID=191870 RepID=UPI001CFDB1C5|nr:uncharacterized protein LOC123253306 [Gracilinanus agilis]
MVVEGGRRNEGLIWGIMGVWYDWANCIFTPGVTYVISNLDEVPAILIFSHLSSLKGTQPHINLPCSWNLETVSTGKETHTRMSCSPRGKDFPSLPDQSLGNKAGYIFTSEEDPDSRVDGLAHFWGFQAPSDPEKAADSSSTSPRLWTGLNHWDQGSAVQGTLQLFPWASMRKRILPKKGRWWNAGIRGGFLDHIDLTVRAGPVMSLKTHCPWSRTFGPSFNPWGLWLFCKMT